MNEKQAIWQRQQVTTRFKNQDMDYMLNWALGVSQILGMSPGQIFYTIHDLKDGDAAGWRNAFQTQGRFQNEWARDLAAKRQTVLAGEAYLGAAYAYRSALQYTDPYAKDFELGVRDMEKAFQCGVDCLGVPLRAIEIPFENTTLPGYFLEQDNRPRPLVVMIGGGDSFREDLFYFAGYPGWKRGYNVIMVDLPGQGSAPNRGLTFRVDMYAPIRTVLDWVDANAARKPEQIALYGVSGGGYFTAQAAANDARVNAWVASTPIYDIPKIFKSELGAALKTPGWVLNTFMRIAGTLNTSAEINLHKYAWQFGTADFKTAVERTMVQAQAVDYSRITCPSLFLVSDAEGEEMRRQAQEIYDDFCKRNANVTLHRFNAQGVDGHCQLSNLRVAHAIVFDWLDDLFGNDPGDVRLRC